MEILSLIPTPKDYITEEDFLAEYKECFEAMDLYDGVRKYTLKENYRFDGWHKILSSGKLWFADWNLEDLSSFVPVLTKQEGVKYYVNVGTVDAPTSFDISEMDENRFKGYYKIIPGLNYTFISISKDNIYHYTNNIREGINLIWV